HRPGQHRDGRRRDQARRLPLRHEAVHAGRDHPPRRPGARTPTSRAPQGTARGGCVAAPRRSPARRPERAHAPHQRNHPHCRRQAKFLRALQEREVERLGSSATIPVDTRIIAATNRDLQKALEEGVLREDLYYRLNVILLRVPPLRERMDDVPILAMHFLRKYAAREHSSMSSIAEEALNVLLSYSWPGNVRELENASERAVVRGKGAQ